MKCGGGQLPLNGLASWLPKWLMSLLLLLAISSAMVAQQGAG